MEVSGLWQVRDRTQRDYAARDCRSSNANSHKSCRQHGTCERSNASGCARRSWSRAFMGGWGARIMLIMYRKLRLTFNS